MANPWFKFYGSEFLSDQKIGQLNGNERSCWVTLLCWASQTKDGIIKFISEEQLLHVSGVKENIEILKKLEKLNMISVSNGNVTVVNWEKRQLSESISRVREYRLKQKSNANVTTEEIREEKKREEKSSASISFLENLPTQVLQELSKKYKITSKGIQSKATDLKLYCEARAKRYKNYLAFLENALRKDAPKLREIYPLPKAREGQAKPMSEEQEAAFIDMRASLVGKFRPKVITQN